MGSLLKSSLVYLVANVLNAIIPFALIPILTRHLSPGEYGQVAMFQTLVTGLGGVVGISVAGAATRKYYDDENDVIGLRYFIGSCLQILIFTSSVVLCVIALFREKLIVWLDLPITWIILAVAVAVSMVMVQIRLGQWQARKEAFKYGSMQVSNSIINFLLSILLVVAFSRGAEGRIDAQVIATMSAALIALYFLARDGLLGFFFLKPSCIKEAFFFGLPLIPHVAGLFLLNSADRFVINSELGLAAAGIYMVAVQMTGAMGIVFDAINKALIPWLFERLKRDNIKEKRQIVLCTYIWFVLILIAVSVIFVLGPWIIKLVAGDAYGAAGEIIGWLALGQGFNGMYLMVTNYIFYSKRTGLLSVSTVTSGLMNLVLLVQFTQLFGLVGAAMAYSMSMAFRFFCTWYIAQKRHRMPWFSIAS